MRNIAAAMLLLAGLCMSARLELKLGWTVLDLAAMIVVIEPILPIKYKDHKRKEENFEIRLRDYLEWKLAPLIRSAWRLDDIFSICYASGWLTMGNGSALAWYVRKTFAEDFGICSPKPVCQSLQI